MTGVQTCALPIFGKQIEHWNGVDVTVNARPRPGLMFQGGTSTGRTTTDDCDIVDDLPERLTTGPAAFCHVDGKFLTQLKVLGSYTVPRIDVQVTSTVQSVPGPEILANFVATNPEVIRLALETNGRSIAEGVGMLIADAQKGRISTNDESLTGASSTKITPSA